MLQSYENVGKFEGSFKIFPRIFHFRKSKDSIGKFLMVSSEKDQSRPYLARNVLALVVEDFFRMRKICSFITFLVFVRGLKEKISFEKCN